MYRCALCHDSAAVNGLCSGCLNDLRGLYRDGNACCPVCGAASAQAAVCADCRVAPPPFVRLWGSLDYRPPVPALLHDWKHLRRSMMLHPLWTLMRGHPPPWLHTAEIDGVLAMPVSTRRRWQRGFNQCDELADAVCAEYGLPRIGRQADILPSHSAARHQLQSGARPVSGLPGSGRAGL